MQNKGSTLNLNIKEKLYRKSLFLPEEKSLSVTVATVHHIKIFEAKKN